jgi:hypothetical protein
MKASGLCKLSLRHSEVEPCLAEAMSGLFPLMLCHGYYPSFPVGLPEGIVP